MMPKALLVGLMLSGCWVRVSLADEREVTELMQRLQQPGATEFRYEETRHLDLLSSPWKGWGYMLSSSDGSLVKLQLSPQRVIMAISGGQMLYFDAQQKQRQAIPISYAGEAQRQIAAFRALLQGRREELQASYDLAVSHQDSRRTLKLNPKPAKKDEALPGIEVSFDQKDQKRQIVIREVDGEFTEYQMEKTSEGPSLEMSIQRLLQEAVGD